MSPEAKQSIGDPRNQQILEVLNTIQPEGKNDVIDNITRVNYVQGYGRKTASQRYLLKETQPFLE